MNEMEWKKKQNRTNYFFYVHVRLEESVAMEIIWSTVRLQLKVENKINDSYLVSFFIRASCCFVFFCSRVMSKKNI